MRGPSARENCSGNRVSIAAMRTIHKTITTRAKARNLFAKRLILLVNANNKAKLSPVNITARKARS